jgi:hypothetical protein
VRLLEVGVALVQGVAKAVLPQPFRLPPHVGGHVHSTSVAIGTDGVLVDVVAEVHDDVEILLGHPPVGRVEARSPVLARGERESEQVQMRTPHRGRLGASGRADLATGPEPVEVLAPRLEPRDLHMHRMGQFG